jgi:hypothetical protein
MLQPDPFAAVAPPVTCPPGGGQVAATQRGASDDDDLSARVDSEACIAGREPPSRSSLDDRAPLPRPPVPGARSPAAAILCSEL